MARSPNLLDPFWLHTGSVEASATLSVKNVVPVAAPSAQVPYVSGAHAPAVGAMPGVKGQLLDRSELYVLPRMPYPRTRYSPAVGRMFPVPITATLRTTVTTTVTSTVAISAA